MNKAELVAAISDSTSLTKAQSAAALDSVIASITKALKKGEAVALVGFGTFQVRKRAARAGRNPRTGEDIKIDASNIPAFKPGKAFKDAL